MACLVLGATGATGQLLVKELLERGEVVRAVVRDSSRLDPSITGHLRLTVIEASVSELSDSEIQTLTSGCDAVVSCLGHNLSVRGIFGPPYRLVTNTTQRICEALRAGERSGPARFILMNTSGNSNRDLSETIPFAQTVVINLLRLLLPPHLDNEKAADYLRLQVGQSDPALQWVAVRPDALVDEDTASDYSLQPSPTRSAIFDAGETSRINVAKFMTELVTNTEIWERWKGQMPVIYNAATT